jgi:hypothetical protein
MQPAADAATMYRLSAPIWYTVNPNNRWCANVLSCRKPDVRVTRGSRMLRPRFSTDSRIDARLPTSGLCAATDPFADLRWPRDHEQCLGPIAQAQTQSLAQATIERVKRPRCEVN